MTLETFAELYDLNDAVINSIQNKDNNLIFNVTLKVNQELMANGFRPDFDLEFTYNIIFEHVKVNITPSDSYQLSEYSYQDNQLILVINKQKIIIKTTNVIIQK